MTHHRLKKLMLTASVCAVALSGCSWVKEWPPKEGQVKHNAMTAPTVPQKRLMQTADATWLAPDVKPEPPIEHMVPANGEQASTILRVRELEAEIAQMRNDMSMMLPAMTKLAETQTAMRDTLTAAVAPAAGGNMAPPQAAPMPLYNQQPSAASANAAAYIPPAQPVSMASGPGIGHIRFGENKDKTRIVLDAAQQVTFTQDIDNNEQILMVRLPGSAWNTAAQQQVTDSPLVAAYTATPDGAGGTTLAIQLKRPAQVAMAQSLPPGGSKGHRVVIDLAPL